MEFAFFGRVYRDADVPITLLDVWNIEDKELNDVSQVTCNLLENDKSLADLHRRVAWLSQALIEFMDLQGLHFPHHGRWQHTSYLYFEAISALRESMVGMLNGSPRASINVMRSAFEMFLRHCWWHERLFLSETFEPFYDWLEGRKKAPPFKEIIKQNFRSFGLPRSDLSFDKSCKTYQQLSSYVHAPLIQESVTSIGKGNLGIIRKPVLLHWMEIAEVTLRIALEHLVHHKPQSLFPVDINKKFGFLNIRLPKLVVEREI